jgi:hypothetical protein
MIDVLVSWVATRAYSAPDGRFNTVYTVNTVSIDVDHGAVVVNAHSEQEAEGAVTRIVSKKFPTRTVSVTSSLELAPIPFDNLVFKKDKTCIKNTD